MPSENPPPPVPTPAAGARTIFPYGIGADTHGYNAGFSDLDAAFGITQGLEGALAGGAAKGAGFSLAGMFSLTGFLIIGASILGATLLRGKKRGPPKEAEGIKLTQPVSPVACWLMPYGFSWFKPPLLLQYPLPASMNTLKASRGNSTVRIYHAGAGPLSGADLRIRISGVDQFGATTLDSPAEQLILTQIDDDRRVFAFGGRYVIPNTVAIYFDGTLVWVGGPEAGGAPDEVDSTTVTAQDCAARLFARSSIGAANANPDEDIPEFDVRLGCFLPTPGEVDPDSVDAYIALNNVTNPKVSAWKLVGSGRTIHGKLSAQLTRDDWGLAQADDGRQYLWTQITVPQRTTIQLVTQNVVRGFRLSYSVRKRIGAEIKVRADGTTEVHFTEAVGAGVEVRATYKTEGVISRLDGFRYSFSDGRNEQDSVRCEDGSSRVALPVELALTQGTVRRASTSAAVDDVIVGIATDGDGFYHIDNDGGYRGISRKLAMRFKTSAATDQGATCPDDPTTGWVALKDPNTGADRFRLEDFFLGEGAWFFSIAALFAYTKDPKGWKSSSVNWLPTAAYDVEIVAVDAASTDEYGIQRTDRTFNSLVYKSITEVRRSGFVLPHQATLSVEAGEDVDDDAITDMRCAGRLIVQPGSGASVDTTTGLPTPRTVGFSRNPVWIACDYLTDAVAGAGRHFDWSDIDLSSAYTAAAWCDASATLADGTTQTRSLCDIVLGEDGERRSVGDQIAYILAGSGVMAYWRGGWYFVTDQDADPVTDPNTSASFTITEEDDCIENGCELEFAGIDEIPAELQVEFRDSTNHDALTTEPIPAPDPRPTNGRVERVEFPGVRRRTQARHFGEILLNQMRLSLRRLKVVGTIGRGLRLLMLDPGDVVLFTSTRLGITELKCRVMQVGWTSGHRPAVELVEHVPAAYTPGYQGPNGWPIVATAATKDPVVSRLVVNRVLETATEGVGGGA